MPELAEVEFYRRRWDAGIGRKVRRVELHRDSRIFRGTDTAALVARLKEARLLSSRAHGKRMLFRFSRGGWLEVHLGMSGRLQVEQPGFVPGKHDHLALFQTSQTLVLSDPRMFGRVHFHRGDAALSWMELPPAISSREFTIARLREFFRRRGRLPVKSALLVQTMFPGIGNWMADEILWRAGIDPRRLSGSFGPEEVRILWRVTRLVCRGALATVGKGAGDPPAGWLFHQRWKREGRCPRDDTVLASVAIGGRTTRWCRSCQR